MRRKPPDELIFLSKEQKENALSKLKEHITEDLDADIGNLQAEIFLDYITIVV